MKRQYLEAYVTAKTPKAQKEALQKLRSIGCWMVS